MKCSTTISQWAFLLLVIFLFGACKQERLNHQLIPIKESKLKKASKLELYSDYNSPLFVVQLKCLNKESYSADSIEFIAYEFLDYHQLNKLIVQHVPDGYKLIETDRLTHKIEFPENAKSKRFSAISKRGYCESPFNELLRIEYELDDDPKANYTKILGFSNLTFTNTDDFDWDYFVSNNDNMFHFYRNNFECVYNWKYNF